MNGVNCENEFCIYQKQGTCILDSVQLNVQGNCVDCIYINVEKNLLNDLKENLLKELSY